MEFVPVMLDKSLKKVIKYNPIEYRVERKEYHLSNHRESGSSAGSPDGKAVGKCVRERTCSYPKVINESGTAALSASCT